MGESLCLPNSVGAKKGFIMRDHRLNSLGQIISAHNASGGHFFDKDSMRFFNSRVSEMVYPTFGDFGTLFVTSERDSGSSYGHHARFYTVRRAYWSTDNEPGSSTFGQDYISLETVGEFQQYMSRSGAHKAAKRIQLENLVPSDSQ